MRVAHPADGGQRRAEGLRELGVGAAAVQGVHGGVGPRVVPSMPQGKQVERPGGRGVFKGCRALLGGDPAGQADSGMERGDVGSGSGVRRAGPAQLVPFHRGPGGFHRGRVVSGPEHLGLLAVRAVRQKGLPHGFGSPVQPEAES
ncbi:hypothetical protein GY12_11685 [Micrococcus luteus]|nr:hypothetical protein GY12_11685 [Micrococcus luteus]